MPLRLLRAADERGQLGPEAGDDIQLERERQPDRRPSRAQQQLLDFSPDAFRRQVVKRDGAQQVLRLCIGRQLESRGELNRAKHPQAVVGEAVGIDDAEPAGGQVVLAVERIEHLARQRVARDRVNREIPAPCRILDREGGIAIDRKPFVALSGLRLAPRQRDVDVADLVDREALANRIHPAEAFQHGAQPVRRQPEDLEIQILRRLPQQVVADPAADHQRPAAGGLYFGSDRQREVRRRRRHRGLLAARLAGRIASPTDPSAPERRRRARQTIWTSRSCRPRLSARPRIRQ